MWPELIEGRVLLPKEPPCIPEAQALAEEYPERWLRGAGIEDVLGRNVLASPCVPETPTTEVDGLVMVPVTMERDAIEWAKEEVKVCA